MKKILIGVFIFYTFLYLAVNDPRDWIKRMHIRDLSKSFKKTEASNHEKLIEGRGANDNCFKDKSISETFGNICFTESSIIINGKEFELVKREINLWYPKVKVFNHKLYVMFYSGDNQTINLKVFEKSGKGIIPIDHYKVDHSLGDDDYYTIMDIDFYLFGKKTLVAIKCKRRIYYAQWDRSHSIEKLEFITVFDETYWIEDKPTLVGNDRNIYLLFESGSYIGGGTSGGLTLVSKFIDKENHFEHPRVFEWAHLKTRDSSPVNMIKVDNNENIFYKAMENDKYYKTNYNDLSQIQTTDEIFRDIFSF